MGGPHFADRAAPESQSAEWAPSFCGSQKYHISAHWTNVFTRLKIHEVAEVGVPRGEPRESTWFTLRYGNPLMAPGAFPFGTWAQTIWGTEQYDYSSVLARPVHSSTYMDVDVSRWLIGRPFVNAYGSTEITLRTISMQFWMRLRSWLRRTRSRMAGLSPGPGETQRGTLLRLGRPGVNLVWSKERNGLIFLN